MNSSIIQTENPETFLKLVQQNKISEVILFLEQYEKFNHNINSICRIKTGDTPLHIATQFGHLELIKFFVEHAKANLEVANLDGKTPLHDAAHFGQLEVVQYLIEKGATINSVKRADWTPLMLACTKSNVDVVKCLLDHGADVKFCNKDGWNCLHIAVREGNMEIIREILYHVDKDIEVKEKLCKTASKNGRSALHSAVMHGHKEVVEFLLNQNNFFDVNSPDHCGTTSVMEACRFGFCNILIMLVDSYAGNLNLANNNGMNCLHIASEAGQNEVIELLVLKYGMDINSQVETSGLRSIHWAAKEDKVGTIKLLITLGANRELMDKQNHTFLDLARILKKPKTLAYYDSSSSATVS